MSGQGDAAAERSAHVTRGGSGSAPLADALLVEVAPGLFKAAAVARLEAERDALRAALTMIADHDEAHLPGAAEEMQAMARQALAAP